MTIAVPFPDTQPAGFELLGNEPVFDPDAHLQLEEPEEIVMLVDLGYTADEIAGTATPVACSSPFRMLSDEGAEIMLATARRLRTFATPAGDRIEHVVRGGCYRSKWLRDLALSPEIAAHMSAIYGIEVAPHAMPLHLAHMNFEPSSIEKSIDKWHHDTLPLDYVMTVTDPAAVNGGRFEYFAGTKGEMAALAEQGKTPPVERRVAPEFAGPGYAIALHGNMVVHRAGELFEMCERISMVNGYVATNTTIDGQSRTRDLLNVDPPEVLLAEWAKFAAWRSHGRLATMIESLEFTDDVEAVISALEHGIADVAEAIEEMRAGQRPAEHYER